MLNLDELEEEVEIKRQGRDLGRASVATLQLTMEEQLDAATHLSRRREGGERETVGGKRRIEGGQQDARPARIRLQRDGSASERSEWEDRPVGASSSGCGHD